MSTVNVSMFNWNIDCVIIVKLLLIKLNYKVIL